jgi:hypothetical protein
MKIFREIKNENEIIYTNNSKANSALLNALTSTHSQKLLLDTNALKKIIKKEHNYVTPI